MEQLRAVKQFYQLFTPREKSRAWLVFFASFLTALTQALGIFSFFPFINIIIDPAIMYQNTTLVWLNGWLQFTDQQFIIFMGVVVFLFMIISSFLAALTIYLKVHFVMAINHQLSVRLMTVYIHEPYESFLHQNTTEMAKNILDEVNHLTGIYLFAVFEMIINGFMLLLISVTLLLINPLATLIATSFFGIIYGLLNHFIRNRLRRKGKERIAANQKRFKTAHEALSGYKSLKINQAEPYFISQYREHSKAFARANTYAKIAPFIPRYLIEGIAFGSIVLFMVWQLSIDAPIQTLLPLIGVLALAGYRLLPALQKVFQALSMLHFQRAILDKIHQHIKRYPAIKEAIDHQIFTPITFTQLIEVQGLSFIYKHTDKHTLNNISFTINKAHMLGIVGTTGSGKSTLIDSIMGLLTPQSGQIRIDGKPLDASMKPGWFQSIGYVPQTIDLIDDTIINNIAYGVFDDQIDLAKVNHLIDLVLLRPLIDGYANGLHTKIGEKGTRLSGGERQRIGIARALYKNPQILILDEATSALDLATERHIMSRILERKTVTVIMIAHRPQSLEHCDMIIALESGKIVKQGSYHDFTEDIRNYLEIPQNGE